MDFPNLSEHLDRDQSECLSSPDAGANDSNVRLRGNEPERLDSAVTNFPLLPAKAGGQCSADPSRTRDDHEPRWRRRVKLVIFVAVCVELGLILVVMPWLPIWSDNSLVMAHSSLRWFVRQNFVRGLVSGIGLIDLWMGIWEAAKYREAKRT